VSELLLLSINSSTIGYSVAQINTPRPGIITGVWWNFNGGATSLAVARALLGFSSLSQTDAQNSAGNQNFSRLDWSFYQLSAVGALPDFDNVFHDLRPGLRCNANKPIYLMTNLSAGNGVFALVHYVC